MLMATSAGLRPVPDALRARGGVRLAIRAGAGGTRSRPAVMAESGGYRVRFARTDDDCEGVLINTGGGLAGGDRLSVDVTLHAGAAATLTTQSAEKVYRSDGADAGVEVRLVLESGARLDWLPQEQILFDGARLRRHLAVEAVGDARLTLVEGAVFGRLAMGESLRTGLYRDRWRIRRDGRLVFAEDVRLEGALRDALARTAVADGARALASVLHLAPDAEARREEARAALDGAASECGASAWGGLVVVRFLSGNPQAVRSDLARFLERFRGRP